MQKRFSFTNPESAPGLSERILHLVSLMHCVMTVYVNCTKKYVLLLWHTLSEFTCYSDSPVSKLTKERPAIAITSYVASISDASFAILGVCPGLASVVAITAVSSVLGTLATVAAVCTSVLVARKKRDIVEYVQRVRRSQGEPMYVQVPTEDHETDTELEKNFCLMAKRNIITNSL